MVLAPANSAQIAALEAFVLENEDLLELEGHVGRFNIFDALRIANAEIRHSNFLSWLLDPAESHGQGQLFLKAIVSDLLRKAPHAKRPLSALELDGVELRGVDVRREWERIDILLTSEQPWFGLVVENKVGSSEHSDQLRRYQREYRRAFGERPTLFVFLTVEGDSASSDDWITYTYADIYRVLERCRRSHFGALGDDVRTILDHYLRLIGSRFMNDEKVEELCRRIYRNHRQALDLIFDVVNATKNTLVSATADVIRDDSDYVLYGSAANRVDFAPKRWADITPALLDVQKMPHSELRFWLRCWFEFTETSVRFCVEVGPCVDSHLRAELIRQLVDIPDVGLRTKGKITQIWTRVLSETVTTWTGSAVDEAVVKAVQSKLLSIKERLAPVTPVLESLFADRK